MSVLNQRIAPYRFIRLRRRHLFTRSNRLRLRYVVGLVAITSLTLTGFLGSMGSSVAFAPGYSEFARVDMSSPKSAVILASVSADYDLEADIAQDVEQENAGETVAPLLYALESDDAFEENYPVETPSVAAAMGPIQLKDMAAREDVIEIGAGDTIGGALQVAGVSGAAAYRVVKAMGKHYDPRSIKPGQAISLRMEPSANGMELATLSMKINATTEIVIARDTQGRFVAVLDKKQVILHTKAAKAQIETSLYGSAARAGIPASIVAEIIKIYSYDVDFQRDIRRGDRIEALYETYETEDGDFARYGHVLYANLTVGGKKIPVYRYESGSGIVDYYRENGTSLKRILMQTPIDGARMSSGFGMRHHPVLGYNKMHKGVDFAAPRGTPIYAAGNGVIEKAGRNGGYGNYIRIRHNNNLKTAYAHMRRFAKGMSSGKRVKQGQIIGYVGTTGRSTGPHLHFEVLRNGKQVNPKSIKSSAGEKLAGKSLKHFKKEILLIKQKYAKISSDLKFAKNERSD
ncbi:MAG: peptidase M23 [Alphaproteobacteria bacterium]|nr:MAG: peptidase M23 [Alphaproteobacteria bacterium]